MELPKNSLDSKGPIDYENLNIVTHPPPPRRRQSGTSLVPFRPYVKFLTSVRQPFSFANGYDGWKVIGREETFFKQPNARCIGSLIDDCDISDVIRWDIQGESTRLPMMCKLWIIVDGAIVERGKPHLVQDAAIQVFTAGRNLRGVLQAQQYCDQTTTALNRRRRQSWLDVNEYHSVPYYQYTHSVKNGLYEYCQCDMENEQLISTQEVLSDVEEEEVFDNEDFNHMTKENVFETVHNISLPEDRVHISVTTQTELKYHNKSTSIDDQFLEIFNLNLEKNELLLSSIVNPYIRTSSLTSNYSIETKTFYHNGIEYKHQSVSTGDDYPTWWIRLSTGLILSNCLKDECEEKEKSLPPPSPRQNQSVQTDVEMSKLSLDSSSLTVNDNYHIEQQNRAKRILSFTNNSQQTDFRSDVDSGIVDYQMENSSLQNFENPIKESLSKQSESDYNGFVSSLKKKQTQTQTNSTPDYRSRHVSCQFCSNINNRSRTKTSEGASTVLLTTLLERYERTLRERQQAFAIVNNQSLDINHVLNHYKEKIQNSLSQESTRKMELSRDISLLSTRSQEDQSLSTMIEQIKAKYRTMPGTTCQEVIQGYVPSPRLSIKNSSKQRESRFLASKFHRRPDYCELCLNDKHTSSAWIRYNERRVEELQRRIDLMLQIDDNEEAKLFIRPINLTTPTISQRIDNILMGQSKYLNPYVNYRDRLLTTERYRLTHLPNRLIESAPNSTRLFSRSLTRLKTPSPKRVRITTRSVPPRAKPRSLSRPLVSILRRNSFPSMPQSPHLVETSHIWRSRIDGKVYVLKQFNIPRYYRLYNDVAFRQMYDMSRVLDTYLHRTPSAMKNYTSMVKNFALEKQITSTITSAA